MDGLSIGSSLTTAKETFTFVAGDYSYSMKSLLADLISPRVARIHMTDPLANILNIQFNVASNPFYFLDKLINNQEIEVNDANAAFLESFFTQIENFEMLERLTTKVPLTLESAYKSLNIKENRNEDVSIEIKFIALHIMEASIDALKLLSNETLFWIFSSESIAISDEDWLLQLVISIVSSRSKESRVLVSCVRPEYLSPDGFKTFSSFFESSDLNLMTFNSLCNLYFSILSNKIGVELKYNLEKPMEGIMSYLTEEEKKNPHKSGRIEISASSSESEYKRPHNVIDYKVNDKWYSKNLPDSWICFDFVKSRVEVTGYSIKTPGWISGNRNPKSWDLEGSNDGKCWRLIDRHENSYDLDGFSITKTYHFRPTAQFRYIRMRQTGPNHAGNDYLCLCELELFGTLIAHKA